MTTPAQPPNGQPQTPHTGPMPTASFPLPAEASTREVPATFQPQPPVPLPAYEQPAVPQLAGQANVAPQIPEGGYARRFVDLPLPEFDLPGIECRVRLRNPGMMSQGTFEEMAQAVASVPVDEKGEPALSDAEAMPAIYAQIIKLVASWTLWDADSAEDVPALLPSPPTTVEDIRHAPTGAVKAIMAAFQELMGPQ